MHVHRPIVTSALALVLLAPAVRPEEGERAASPQEVPEIDWQPYVGATYEGGRLEGRLGRIRVPENRARRDGPTIEIAFVVYPSTSPDPGPPIVYLAGGPGAPGVELSGPAATEPLLQLLEHGDVIGIDQRGTGLSRPNLAETDFEIELPFDAAVTREDALAAYGDALARSYEYWTEERGVDLAAYNTAESADDVDAVRRALGHERVVLWGSSYGTHLGLAVLRRHPEHVARAVLMKVEGPDHTWKLPSTVQRQLERVSALVAADPDLGPELPDLAAAVGGLLAQLADEPVTLTTDRFGETLSVTIGPYDLQCLVSYALGFASNIATLPAAVHLMTQGEWRHVMGFVLQGRRTSVGSAMAAMMDCASGASPARRKRIERERRDAANLLGDAINAPFYPATCNACGAPDVGDAFRGPLKCDVPVLFVSGELDARTPPDNVEALAGGFANGVHLRVTNSGHDSPEHASEAYCALVHAFLRGEPVESATIELPPIRFRPLRAQ